VRARLAGVVAATSTSSGIDAGSPRRPSASSSAPTAIGGGGVQLEQLPGDGGEVGAALVPCARQRQRHRPRQVLRVVRQARAAHAQVGRQAALGIGEHVLACEQVLGQRQQPVVGEQA
jgi:hypothetical protein